jgi:hypothetical protein
MTLSCSDGQFVLLRIGRWKRQIGSWVGLVPQKAGVLPESVVFKSCLTMQSYKL